MSPTIGIPKCLMVLLCLLLSPIATAAGLGELSLASSLGQPLNARIDIFKVSEQDLGTLRIQLAEQSYFEQTEIPYSPELQYLELNIVPGPNGTPEVSLTSSKPVLEPFLSFILELSWSSGTYLREYTILLDPVVMNTEPVLAQALHYSQPGHDPSLADLPIAETFPMQGRQTDAVTRVDELPTQNTEAVQFLTVERGENLLAIARQLLPDSVTLEQATLAIVETNPHAFPYSIDLLETGVELMVPSDSVMRSYSPENAREILKSMREQKPNLQPRRAGQMQAQTASGANRNAGQQSKTQARAAKPANPGPDTKIALAAAVADDSVTHLSEVKLVVQELRSSLEQLGTTINEYSGQLNEISVKLDKAVVIQTQNQTKFTQPNPIANGNASEAHNSNTHAVAKPDSTQTGTTNPRKTANPDQNSTTGQDENAWARWTKKLAQLKKGAISPPAPATASALPDIQASTNTATNNSTGLATDVSAGTTAPNQEINDGVQRRVAAEDALIVADASTAVISQTAATELEPLTGVNPQTESTLQRAPGNTFKREPVFEKIRDIGLLLLAAVGLFVLLKRMLGKNTRFLSPGPDPLLDNGMQMQPNDVQTATDKAGFFATKAGQAENNEQQLLQRLSRQPLDQNSRFELLKIYFERKAVPEFAANAQKMYAATGGKINQWQDVIAMGLTLDSDMHFYTVRGVGTLEFDEGEYDFDHTVSSIRGGTSPRDSQLKSAIQKDKSDWNNGSLEDAAALLDQQPAGTPNDESAPAEGPSPESSPNDVDFLPPSANQTSVEILGSRSSMQNIDIELDLSSFDDGNSEEQSDEGDENGLGESGNKKKGSQ